MRPIKIDGGVSKTIIPTSDQEVKRAPQVCSHCKSIKKGCDKKLPANVSDVEQFVNMESQMSLEDTATRSSMTFQPPVRPGHQVRDQF
ncbi:hypothetical protein HYFRA_00002619 [Hymenoscyphus fraxineus]|uniref:Uncharacterized protein n=1 Tax=Hymenoscyphus fraxineus TaxID=746836 RepID=A0A9N9LCQ7_9HELO|nr:hypothetical protein HYFRA_00002619 [Hymenoscyphus fraxineus]